MESQGFRRMEIVEVSDSESDEGASAPAAAPPKSSSAPSGGWRRMDIVEASDDESDDGAAPLATSRGNSASSTSAPRPAASEPSADIKVEHTVKGIEAAKDRANGFFSQGSLEESVRWFGKAIWVAESGQVADVPATLESILHSNRAFAYVKLRRWPEAEEDCCAALRLNPHNTKAKYRRAEARFELGKADEALRDVDEVLGELPDGQNQKEARGLRQRIQDRLAITKPPDAAGESTGGWRRMEIVEASDDEDEPGQVFRKIPIVEVDEEEEGEEERAPETELYPEVQIERTRQGIEKAKNQGNALFSQGKYEESERWFSKAIWLLRSALVKDVPSDLHSILHSNHAFALTKLQRWSEAEEECSAALTFNSLNTKATYRRALSRFELGKLEEALKDVEVVIKEMPDPLNNKEATELKQKINEALKAGAPKPKEAASAEPFPDIDIKKTREGIEAAKNQANTLFSKGSLEECVRWFSKALWLLQSGKVTDVPSDLHSVLHSNRSFAYIKMKKWREAEEDGSAALGLNPANTKAKYRRAVARFELGRAEAALQDVEQVLVELPDPASNKEAKELRERIARSLQGAAPNGAAEEAGSPTGAAAAARAAAAKAAAKSEPAQPAPGFKRMQIVEASDSEEDEKPAKAPKPAAVDAKPASPPSQPAPGFKRMQIVEASDSEEEEEKKPSETPAPAAKPKSPTAAADTKPASPSSQPAPGFKRMQIVEASDSEEDEKPSKPAAAPASPPAKAPPKAEEPEIFPDIEVEPTPQGVEAAKNRANALFSKGSLEESVRWFTKAIWLVQSKRAAGVPADLQSILHSNRAFAYVRLLRWSEAEEDSSAALALNGKNSKAVYRRALARFELGKLEAALKDVDQVLRDIPDPGSNKEAVELKRKISERLAAPAPAAAKAPEPAAADVKPTSPASQPAPGFKRMQIVEASDSEEEEEKKPSQTPAPAAKPKSPTTAAKPASPPSQPAPGFKRMQIVEASDSEEEDAIGGDAQPAAAPGSPAAKGAPKAEELFPDIKVEQTRQGIEAAKNQANTLFSKGSVEESVRWFSKAIWLVQSERVPDVPLDLQSILHSNRAFAYIRLQRWSEAAEDCSVALAKNGGNTKARYRRAQASFEQGKLDVALQDVEQVIKELPDPSANKEAVALEQRIHEAMKPPSPSKAPQKAEAESAKAGKQEPSAGGFRRMEIVEASDDESDDAKPAPPPATPPATPPQPSSLAPGFKRMQIVEASDDESDDDAAGGATKPAAPAQPPKAEEPEAFPDIKVEQTRQGIEAAKNQANALFSKGDVAESVRWFSKAIWLVESGRAPGVPSDLRSILHANRAFAHLKLRRWRDAEEDCSAALALNSANTKAKYRRAWARFELGEAEAALQEVEAVLLELPAGSGSTEAVDLKQRILAAIEASKPKEKPAAKEAPRPGSPAKRRVSFNEAKNEYASLNDIPKYSPAATPKTPRASAAEDPEEFPDIKVERTKQGIEAAKNQANVLFSKGSIEESVRWFSKALWLVQTGRVSDSVPSDLRSILRSNRAFAYIRLKRWKEADEDCSEALALNGGNTKAKYRRAMARFELGRHQEALLDVEQVLKELPDPNANKEAMELKERIAACLKPAQQQAAPEAASAAGAKDASAAPGWRRMEIVEASDDESGDDAPKQAPASTPPAKTPDPAPGFKRMTIVEESDDDDAGAVAASATAAPQASKPAEAEPHPEVKVEPTRQGIEAAKDHANGLFARGSLEESVKWFSKALWLVKSGRALDVAGDLHSILHSNRAFAYVKLKRWSDAEQDCSDALALNAVNTKARYRRALARCELGQADGALQDVERVLQELPDPGKSREALELKQRIEELREAAAPPTTPRAAVPAPQQPPAGGGWKRMEIVEASDDEDSGAEPAEEVKGPAPAAPAPAATQPAPGFKRMQIVEASDDESEGEAEKAAAAPAAAPAPAAKADPFPDIQVECTVQGIEAAKQQANSLFSKGSLEESARWFSKAIFLAESGRVPGLPSDQHSVLHSNRSFAYVKLQKWAEAEEDSCAALDLNPSNTKAKYRRALARFELGKLEAALQEVDEVLKDLPDPSSNREAAQLKQRILEQQSKKAPTNPPKDAKQAASKAPAPAREDAPTRAVGSTATAAASEDPEPMPDIVIELSKKGIEQAKNQANALFSQGALDESVRWFSKALWLLESRRVTGVPHDLHSILHSNRAFAHIRLERWREAEEDCAAALALNGGNTKARYRRAMACFELGKLELASQDVEQVLRELPDASSNREARELQGKILERRQQEAGGKEKSGGPSVGKAVEQAAAAAPDRRGPPPGSEEEFPDIRIEHSAAGIQKAKDQGNLLFSQGSLEESARWFSKALWLLASGRVEGVPPDAHSILHSNRAFAYIRLRRWAEAAEDGSAALALNSQNRKARYRRALALVELGRLEAALEDAEHVLREVSEPSSQREASELKQRILQSLGRGQAGAAAAGPEPLGSPSGGAAKGEASSLAPADATKRAPATSSTATVAPTPLAESGATTVKPAPASPAGSASSPIGSAEAMPRSVARARGAVAVRTIGTPSVPSSGPKTASELLRHFNSMKRHPDVLARYVRERVPPQLTYSLFSKAPIEPDDLATLLSALRTNAQERVADFSPEVVADYLRHLLRSRNAETQFAMLSASEKQVLRELVNSVPSGSEGRRSLEGSLAKVLD